MRLRLHLTTGEVIDGKETAPGDATPENVEKVKAMLEQATSGGHGQLNLETVGGSWVIAPLRSIAYVELAESETDG